MVDQVADLFHTTHKVKTQQVVKSRGQHCGDIELAGYLANEVGPVPLVLDLLIDHDRVRSSTDPTLDGHLRYPNNLDQSLNDAAADKIRKYRLNLSDFYSYRLIGKLTAFLQLQEFSLRKQTLDSSTSTARLFLLCSNLGLEIFTSSLSLGVPVPRPTQCMRDT
jgi:hypothetical protein